MRRGRGSSGRPQAGARAGGADEGSPAAGPGQSSPGQESGEAILPRVPTTRTWKMQDTPRGVYQSRKERRGRGEGTDVEIKA